MRGRKCVGKSIGCCSSAAGGLGRQTGIIEQQLKALDPTANLRDYAPVFRKLFTGDELTDTRLWPLLNKIANDPKIDFTQDIRDIRTELAKSTDPMYAKLNSKTLEGRALLSTLVAFAKTHADKMTEIELRSLKMGETREAIEKSMDALKESKNQAIIGGVREMSRKVELEERFRNTRLEQAKELRRANKAVDQARDRIRVADAAAPALVAEHARLADALQLSSEFTWRHGAPYNVPDKPDATSAEVAQSVKKLSLDSTGRVTQPDAVRGDIDKMLTFLSERDRRALAGDQSAHDSVYQAVKRQAREMLANKDFQVRVGPAERFMLELSVMPAGKRVADAFGTPAARMIDRIMNHFTSGRYAEKPTEERIGRKTDQLENPILALMPRVSRQYLRDNFLNIAKKTMESQRELEEAYSDQPEKLQRALYGKVRQAFLKNDSLAMHVGPVIDRAMPLFERLLEHQKEASRYQFGLVEKSGLGVLDPRLKVLNPATGKTESAIRRHTAVASFTFARKFHAMFGTMVNAMRNSGWDSLSDRVKDLADTYREDGPDAAREAVATFFNHAEYHDQVNESFFRAIAEMERDSPLDAPSLGDGITRPPADTNMTREAYEASKGEPVAFWGAPV